MGTEEKEAENISNWKNYTSGSFQKKLLQGNHFFIHNHPDELARVVRNCYDRSKVLQY